MSLRSLLERLRRRRPAPPALPQLSAADLRDLSFTEVWTQTPDGWVCYLQPEASHGR